MSHSACWHPSASAAASLCFPFAGALARAADLHVGATPGALLHGPAGMAPPGLLGLGPLASHGASVSAHPSGRGARAGVLQGWGAPPHPDLRLLVSSSYGPCR